MLQENILQTRLRDLRVSHQMTQKELSDKLNVTPKVISFYELGQRKPPQETLIRIANIFGVSIDYLLGRDDIKNHVPTDQEVTVPARDFLRLLCKSSPEALEILDRMDINANGEVNITGVDMASQAVINHQLRGLLAALKAAKIENGKAHAEFTPNPKEATDD